MIDALQTRDGNQEAAVQAFLRPRVAWVVLGLCLLTTVIGWQVSSSQVNRRAEEAFHQHTLRFTQGLQARLFSYEQLLKGARGLFAASRSVELSEWQAFTKGLEWEKHYPGIRTLGFIASVHPSQLASFVASNQTLYGSRFAIHPSGVRSTYAVTQYLPSSDIVGSDLGFDIGTESRRWEAAQLARDSGAAALTRRIRLLQNADETPAMMLLLPVYRTGSDLSDVEQRRAALSGWVYASFVLEEFMAGLLDSKSPEIAVEIFDDSRAGGEAWLYDSEGPLHPVPHSRGPSRRPPVMQAVNRTWSLQFRPAAGYEPQASQEPRLLLLGGTAISFLLFAITRSLASNRQQALALTRQMTERLRIQESAVISSNNGIFITDALQPRNPILYANPAMEKITGYQAEELIDEDLRVLLGRDQDQASFRSLRAAMEQAQECRVTLRCYRKDGSLFWNELSISPVRDSHGMVNHFVGITEDITERKNAEETLRAASALQRAILDSAGYMVISTTPEGIIRLFNTAAERMTGYKAAEVIGRPTSVLMNEWTGLEARARELSEELGRPINPDFEVLVAKARLGQADEHEWDYLRRDGNTIPLLLSVTPVRDERGIILGFMGIGIDMTERKRAESLLQQARQAAEAANLAKGEFLANMSHEIRTPMNAVIGMTELALNTELTFEQRAFLSAARNSATDLLTIINDILDFSKIEAGKLELFREPFPLRDSLTLALKAFSLRAAEKRLELSLRIDADVPEMLLGDVGRLRQIVNNLVGNALKFTEQGEIRVEVALAGSGTTFFTKPSRVARGVQAAPPCLLHFTVADTGIGIPQHKQASIFEAFTQADASVTRQYGGTGLGLAICTRLCHLMAGEIWVESEPGQGSWFHFTAGFAIAAEDGSIDPALDDSILARCPVVVADDNASTRQSLSEMVAQWRLIPLPAASAAELHAALGAAVESPGMSFVLLDAQLVGSETLALAAELKNLPQSPEVILLQPSACTAAQAERFQEAGVRTFLVKPVGHSELLSALRHCAGAFAPPVPVQADASPSRVLQVLLAEDNAVNRELAITVLRKMGHTVVSVVNGQQALAAWESGGFDLILMDVQMPSMDGIEATTLIREREAGTGRHIPIIGLTAHAMIGDREHGLAAGMDEYVTKPIHLDDLMRAVRKWGEAPPSVAGTPPSFRPEKLLKSLGGDTAALRRLVRIYLDTTPPLMEKLIGAHAQRDAPGLLHAAHTLKGSLTQLDCPEAAVLAGMLETKARAGQLDGLDSQLVELQDRVDLLKHSVEQWLGTEPVPI